MTTHWSISTLLLLLITLLVSSQRVSGEVFVTLEDDVILGAPFGWVDLGPSPLSHPFSAYIALTQSNLHLLHDFLERVSVPKSHFYGKYETIEKINKMIEPKREHKLNVQKWLESHDLTYHYLTPDWMEVTGKIEQFNSLLSITLHSFQNSQSGVVISRSVRNYKVPSSVAPSIDFISNILRFPSPQKGKRILKREEEEVEFVTPELIQSLYNISLPPSNPSNIQAVASFLEQYYSPDDLSLFQTKFDLPQQPIEKTIGYNNPSNPGVEASLDVQYLYGITNSSVRTWVYSTNGTTPSQNEPFLFWLLSLSNSSPLPWVISMSYQDYEYTVSKRYAQRVCNEFAKYSSTGITFITGSGDWGVGCDSSYSCSNFTSDFPSSCPYVISTGATSLVNNQTIEEGVDFSSGGFSNYFAMPFYQFDVVSSFLNSQSLSLPPSSFFNRSGRAFPDVSAVGTNFAVIVEGKEMPVGGTSASTPTFGAVLSLINSLRLSSNLPTLGFALPFLYEAYSFSPSAFHDITQSQVQDKGCCGYSFTATEGWDPYTGLGTPNSFELTRLALSPSFFNFP